MASGEARHLHAKFGKKVVVTNPAGVVQWVDLFDGLPYILNREQPGTIRLINSGGARPYIVGKFPTRWKWRAYTPKPAEIAFRADELQLATGLPFGFVMVEPNVKATGHTNKAWPWERWQELINSRPEVKFVQCVPTLSTRTLAGVHVVLTPTFRHALAVLSRCRALVTTEGGLMHGAAAVKVPAVVLWSEFISPDVTGYAMHRNLRHAGQACGSRLNCSGCRKAMAAISVLEVADELALLLNLNESKT